MRARLVFTGPDMEAVAGAIEPDNLPNMSLSINGDSIVLEFSTERIGTLLSTADDLLMNIKVAQETVAALSAEE